MLVLTSAPFLTFPIRFPFTVVGAFKFIVVFVSLDTFPLLLTSPRCFSSEPDASSLISDSLAALLEEAVVATPLDIDGVAVAVALLEAPLDIDGVADVASPLDVDCFAIAAALLEAPLDVDGVAVVAIVTIVATPLDVDGVSVCPSSTKLMSSGETCALTPREQVGCLKM